MKHGFLIFILALGLICHSTVASDSDEDDSSCEDSDEDSEPEGQTQEEIKKLRLRWGGGGGGAAPKPKRAKGKKKGGSRGSNRLTKVTTNQGNCLAKATGTTTNGESTVCGYAGAKQGQPKCKTVRGRNANCNRSTVCKKPTYKAGKQCLPFVYKGAKYAAGECCYAGINGQREPLPWCRIASGAIPTGAKPGNHGEEGTTWDYCNPACGLRDGAGSGKQAKNGSPGVSKVTTNRGNCLAKATGTTTNGESTVCGYAGAKQGQPKCKTVRGRNANCNRSTACKKPTYKAGKQCLPFTYKGAKYAAGECCYAGVNGQREPLPWCRIANGAIPTGAKPGNHGEEGNTWDYCNPACGLPEAASESSAPTQKPTESAKGAAAPPPAMPWG